MPQTLPREMLKLATVCPRRTAQKKTKTQRCRTTQASTPRSFRLRTRQDRLQASASPTLSFDF
eukprot:5967492-Pleurochrysis_carterae.AAC.1